MPAKKRGSAQPAALTTTTLRFAHPFVDAGPLEDRRSPTDRLLTHIQGHLEKIPKAAGNSTFDLAHVVGSDGAKEIESSGRLLFHAVGDTGNGDHSPQSDVAAAMAADYDPAKPGDSPAFFFHLGDVIYGPHKDELYRDQYYAPYRHYPGKIIAIPGNHDGETFPETDPKTLQAFIANFVKPTATTAKIAGSIYRQAVLLPGVYWLLETSFVRIIGLYSNAAENPGFISGDIPTSVQRDWLAATLKRIKAAGDGRKLIFATHHPPFSSGGHSGSKDMLAEIDAICEAAGVWPDLFLSGHSHNYQRYERTKAGKKIPFIVAGTGGHGLGAVKDPSGQTIAECKYEKGLKDWGYLLVEASAERLTCRFFRVDGEKKSEFDSVAV